MGWGMEVNISGHRSSWFKPWGRNQPGRRRERKGNGALTPRSREVRRPEASTEGFPEQVKSRQYPGTLSITETQAAVECEMHHIPTKRWTIPLRYIQLLWYFNGFFLQTLFFRAILDSPRVHSSQLRFTLASVLSVCLDTCIMTCIYH